MRLILLILFIAMPLLEIAVFIQMGHIIGFWMTLLLVVATALIGTTVLHAQGFTVWQRFGDSMRQGAPPIVPVIEGVLLLVAGALLLTPGLITDTIGALLLVPPFREWLAKMLIDRALAAGNFQVFQSSPYSNEADPFETKPQNQDTVIDGEFERVDEHTINPNRPNRDRH